MKTRTVGLAAFLLIGTSLVTTNLWAQPSPPSRLDSLLFPLERSFSQAAAGDWEGSLNLLEQFAMRWHILNPTSSGASAKTETALNAAARALLQASTNPGGVLPALADLSKTLGDYLATSHWEGDPASPQFFTALAAIAGRGLDSAQDSQPQKAATNVQLFDALWGLAEDSVHEKDPGSYARIEASIDNSLSALKAQPADFAGAQASLKDLLSAVQNRSSAGAAATSPVATHGVPELLGLLAQSKDALAAGNPVEASNKLQAFVSIWPLVEGDVKAKSAKVYSQIENEMTEAGSLLLSGPTGRGRAAQVMSDMSAQLSGLGERTSYTAWDAGMILLREGMEALLVLAALLAMQKKAGAPRGETWVWSGAGTGLLLSGILAVILGFVITAAAAGSAREQLEGFVGLASVALMVTVGAWLHRKSSLQSWNAFIKNKVGSAVATGSMWSIFALALLAVLREGAESIIFYIGIASAISLAPLLLGIGCALVILVVIGFLIIRFSVRLPLRWFFLVATLLIYYLAFKIAGESIHSLQIVGMLPAHSLGWLPSASFLGMYPTWETFAPQMAVLLYILAELLFTELRRLAGSRAQAGAGPAGAPNQ
ncbi:MAG TPA: FTR1 family protein [Spirochaetia bacterium]|nr:FTR1 family protein [Spirochaetia bacterium]